MFIWLSSMDFILGKSEKQSPLLAQTEDRTGVCLLIKVLALRNHPRTSRRWAGEVLRGKGISFLWGSHIWVPPLIPSGFFEDTYVCWREGSLSKVISKQAWGPEFDHRLHRRARCSMYAYVNSVLGQCRQEESEALLAGQSRQIFESSSSRFSEKHCLEK